MAYVIWLLTSIVVGIIAAWMAKSKGKDPVVWFALGFFLNILALVALALTQKRLSAAKT